MEIGRGKYESEGIKEVVLAIRPDTDFDTLISSLKEVLTLRPIGGFGGCDPCHSGLDRLVITSRILEQVRQ